MLKNESTKSQIFGQAFIYILTLVLVAFILIYGYNAINGIRNRAEGVSCLQLRNDLSGAIESITGDYGSVKRKDIQLCKGYSQICFVESFENIQNPPISRDSEGNPIVVSPLIINSISDRTGKNVFLLGGSSQESFYAGNISLEGNTDIMCIKAAGDTVRLRLEGMGNHVLLKKWA